MTRFKQICLEFAHSHVPLGTIHLCKHCHFFVLSGCVNVLSCMPVRLSHGKLCRPSLAQPSLTLHTGTVISVPEIQQDVLHV